MSTVSPSQALVPFGFTALESEIYAFLLGESPATGYRIAQAIGKPVANTYKAIQTLENKGAVVVDDGENRLCRAVPAEELLTRLGREFELRRQSAVESLRSLDSQVKDDRIYALRSSEQALHRAQMMVETCTRVCLVQASSNMLRALAPQLEAAAARGVETLVVTYTRSALSGVEVVVSVPPAIGSGDELMVVVDGVEALVSEINGSLAQGFWTRNRFVSRVQQQALAAQHCLGALAEKIEEGAGQKRLTRTLREHRDLSGLVP